MAPNDDLTARARIRQAALEQFAQHGYERTTIRGIAAAADVSLGLVRHHYGSKQELRDAVDAYVMAEIRRVEQETRELAGDNGDLGPAVVSRAAIKPFQRYLVRGMLDGSPTFAAMFDQFVELTEYWIAQADEHRTDPPLESGRTRAALWMAMVLGVPLLHDHVSRVLGVDILDDSGDRQLVLGMLDIYSHALITPELAASAAKSIDPSPSPGGTDD
jgi:AcrR family transcriptional regulator